MIPAITAGGHIAGINIFAAAGMGRAGGKRDRWGRAAPAAGVKGSIGVKHSDITGAEAVIKAGTKGIALGFIAAKISAGTAQFADIRVRGVFQRSQDAEFLAGRRG